MAFATANSFDAFNDNPSFGTTTALGNVLAAHIPDYNTEWSKHLAEMLELPLDLIPKGDASAVTDEATLARGRAGTASAGATQAGEAAQAPGAVRSASGQSTQWPASGGINNATSSSAATTRGLNEGVGGVAGGEGALESVGHRAGAASYNGGTTAGEPSTLVGRALAGALAGLGSLTASTGRSPKHAALPPLPSVPSGVQATPSHAARRVGADDADRATIERGAASIAGGRAGSLIGGAAPLVSERVPSVRRSPSQMPQGGFAINAHLLAGAGQSTILAPTRDTYGSVIAPTTAGNGNGATMLKKNSLNMLVHVIREFVALYGPIIILFENLHEFDTWSWQLLVKVAEVLTPSTLILATTRPIDVTVTPSNAQVRHSAHAYHPPCTMLLCNQCCKPNLLHPCCLHAYNECMRCKTRLLYPLCCHAHVFASVCVCACVCVVHARSHAPVTVSMCLQVCVCVCVSYPVVYMQAHSKAALNQKVSTMYRHLLKLPSTSKVHLEPFTFQQTKALMQALANNHLFPDQYVLAVKEKTGGMPLYIEKVRSHCLVFTMAPALSCV